MVTKIGVDFVNRSCYSVMLFIYCENKQCSIMFYIQVILVPLTLLFCVTGCS